MIHVSTDFDLGLDRTRIKDHNDADRQLSTASLLLKRFFDDDLERRWEVQVLADEVGMGKTFVALAVMYSILAHIRAGNGDEDLRGCYQKILVITPQNSSLFKKWWREVSEFVRRCVHEELRGEVGEWFAPVPIERLDDLALEMKRPGRGRRVLVTHMGVLGGGKFQRYDVKRRFLLGAVFRYWGNRFHRDARQRLLRGAPDSWPRNPNELSLLDDAERQFIPFNTQEDVVSAIAAIDRASNGASPVEELLGLCQEIAAPYVRHRDALFGKVESALVRIYREAVFASVRQALPLVVVDEAHNWKNGPSRNANGFKRFAQFIAPRARRVLMLTATPFQLRPDEMLEILKVDKYIEPCPTQTRSVERREHLRQHRRDVIKPVLQNSSQQSRRFAKAWARLPRNAASELAGAWASPQLEKVRNELLRIANLEGVIEEREMSRLIDGAVAGFDPNVRELLREALMLYAYNADLSQELGALVVRHRRKTDHRLVRVGAEYAETEASCAARSDRHVLHSGPGIDVRGPGELPHYLLMRCVSEAKGGKGKSSLGSALTGCYSTLLVSAEGKDIHKSLGSSPTGKAYLDLLLTMVDESRDAEHPKVKELVDSILRCWRAGEKTLVFCFRTHTARRLRDLADQSIRAEMAARRERVLGGADSLKTLRARFTGRDRDLIVLGLDRVLWSLIWAAQSEEAPIDTIEPEQLRLADEDLKTLAEVAIRYGVDLTAERVDRVFLHRAHEHVVAQRLLRGGIRSQFLRDILQAIADETWVRSPYALHADGDQEEGVEEREETADFDERGVHTTYDVRVASPARADVLDLAATLAERRTRASRQDQIPILDVYVDGPSFWVGPHPRAHLNESRGDSTAQSLTATHAHLLGLSRSERVIDWPSRLLVFQAMRRALLRESVLLRLLPERSDREEAGWGELIVKAFFSTLPGQSESMADRIGVFLEDLRAASGSIHENGTMRYTLYDATRLRGQRFVALVDGSTKPETRERVFAGFNTPLLPEVLICTTVGQEGIDLHRHCRNVVHYDLAWNPAVLEQRTGRVDRIGSKTFRERSGTNNGHAFLDVGVPFLAGTYDERMYEELRVRAQTFEVLTGGDVGADNVEGRDDTDEAEGHEEGLEFPPLPPNMMSDLRVQLHVWQPPAPDGRDPDSD